MSKRDKVLSSILGLLILAAIGAIVYVTQFPPAGQRFTEFYILGLEGKATDYPKELKVGEDGKVTVGIINQEHETVSYRIEVKIDGVTNNELEPIVLGDEQKCEKIVSFAPHKVGDNQKVEFLLYKTGENEPCLKPLHLWVNVKEQK